MKLRNVVLNETDRQELKSIVFFHGRATVALDGNDCNADVVKSLTLYNVSSLPSSSARNDEDGSPRSLNCDFLLDNENHEGDENAATTSSARKARLEELTIERCHLDVEGCKVLGKALRCCRLSLKSLKLINVTLPSCDDGINAFDAATAGSSSSPSSSLESIELRRVKIEGGHQRTGVFLRSLYSALRESCAANLRELRIIDCDIIQSSSLADAVRSCEKLELLDLSRNQIGATGVQVLIRDGLLHHENLKRLILSHNPIGDDGAAHLSRFLSRSSSGTVKKCASNIESVSIIDCDLWKPGYDSIAREIKHFLTIKELRIDDEFLDDDGDKANTSASSSKNDDSPHRLDMIVESLRTSNVVIKRIFTPTISLSSSSNRDRYYHRDIDGDEIVVAVDPRWKQIEYYLELNRAKRRITSIVARTEDGSEYSSESSSSKKKKDIPFVLWPTVLQQPQLKQEEDKLQKFNGNSFNIATNADVWYHVLQRRPDLIASNDCNRM